MKFINILRIIGFIGLIITSIPLVVKYFIGRESVSETITHLHVWIGIAFIITAIISMIMKKKEQTKNV